MSRGHSGRLGPAAAATLLGTLWLAPTVNAAGTFGYRKAITLNGVVGVSHAGFPVLISLVDPDLRDGVSSPRGYDIVFRGEDPATCAGPSACTLDHEIESWDAATGTLLAWVRVPSLSVGTVIYLYYGDSRTASSREAGHAVWDADYVGVWHLEEAHNAAVNGYRDSSRYGNHGHGGKGVLDAAPNPVVGFIGAGQHFDDADGTYDFIDGGDDGTLHVAGDQITLEAWVRHDITTATPPYGILNHKGWSDGYRLALQGTPEPRLVFSLPGSTHLLQNTPLGSLGPNQWHHVVATYDGATMNVFVDGVNEGSLPKTGNVAPSVNGQPMWIGHGDEPGQPWSNPYEGDLDEIRISRVARSAEWIATEYTNQSAPWGFYIVGAETSGPFVIDTLAVNYRSIGTAGVLYSTGDASVAQGGTTVTFGGSASLPPNVGRGDALTFTGPPVETLHILFRDSATQVTLQTPATAVHPAQGYTIARAFNTLGDWESAREGDLVLERRREVGIAYNDGPLAGGLMIDGSTTDPVHSMTLTVAPGQRHLGVAGTGTVIDNGASASPAIRVLDDHVTIEWLEIKGSTPAFAHGIELANGLDPDNLGTVRYNIIHDFGGDAIRLADPDTIVDIYGNVIYEAEYGIHLPVDLTPAARVNAFSNTIYGCNAPAGPSGVKSDVRQTSVRVDLRNNIAHSNAGGDFGVGPLFDYGYFCNPGCTQIANGGVLGPTEFLADGGNNIPLDFTIVDTSCLYLGSAWPFRGVSVALAAPGALSGTDIRWDYWNGTSWTSLEAGSFADGTGNFAYTGHLFWPNDPPGWAPTSVSTSPDLYYVRACLAGGSYTTLPIEERITRIDVSMSSRNNLSGDITGRPHSALWCGSTGVDQVPLAAMGFISTTVGAEDLHIGLGSSAAEDAGFDFSRRFLADIDGALRVDPWDIGADEASASTGPDLAITKDDGQTTAVPGTPVLYTITVTNNGPDLLTSVTVLDAVPPEFQGPVFTPSTGDYDPGTGVWSGLSLGPSASVTLTLQGTIAPGALGNLVNTAQVDPPDGLSDPDRSNNSATDVDTLTPEADLALTKADDLDPIEIGNLLTYTLTITNTGPSDATGVILTDMLVPELDYQSATPSQGLCNFDAPTRTVGCTLGALASGGSAVVTLVVRPLAVGTLGNTADVSGNEPDPVSGNDSATETTTVQTASDGVRFFTVTSTFEQNVLEWLNPATAAYLSTEIVYRTDTFPTGPTDPLATSIYNGGVAGMKDRLVHATGAGTNGQTFYYGAFVHLAPGPTVSSGRFSSGRPFDNSGPVKWAFSTGAFSITPPTVGGVGVVAPANDRALYAMERGPLGGEWPAGWEPVQLGGAVQSRSPLVPLTVSGANPVVYLGAQDGKVYVVNGTLGGAAAFPWAPTPIGGMVQAAPAGIFTAWGGAQNYLLVGTRDDGADNLFVALNPDTPGNILGTFDNGGSPNGIGIITGMATVDYATNRVYFTSYENPSGSNGTLWCLQIGPPGPVLSLVWQRALHDIDGSPVVNGGRVYVGSTDAGGTVYSINAATGSALDDRTFVHGDGLVNGFVWPDRGSADVYFATDNFVWGISDTGAPNMPNKFPSGISLGGGGVTPSSLLFVPGSHYVYVGGSDGRLYEIDVLGAAPTLKSQPLGDGLATVGAPSLDWLYSLIHVGTEAGIFYAVDVPLP